MALCINCYIAVNIKQQYHYNKKDMSPEIISIIEEWTAHEMPDGSNICQECFDLLTTELNNRKEGNSGDRQLGHPLVCVCCGLSLSRQSRRKSRPLHIGTAQHSYIANITSPRQIPATARACNACWQRAYYHVRHIKQEINVHDDPPTVESGSSSDAEPLSPPSSEMPVGSEPSIQEHTTSILLEGYRRTPDTPNHCFVPECTNAERRRVPLYLRKRILIDCKIYVTSNARVCESHLGVYNFDFLNDFYFMPDFTSNLIVDMLDLLRKHTSEGVVNQVRA